MDVDRFKHLIFLVFQADPLVEIRGVIEGAAQPGRSQSTSWLNPRATDFQPLVSGIRGGALQTGGASEDRFDSGMQRFLIAP